MSAAAREPDRTELKAWYAKNSSTFALPNRVSFRHLYFSPDRRGARAHEDAANALTKLAGQPQDSKLAASIADPFMFQDYYRDRAPEQLAKEFGPQFALAVSKLAPGSWQGPIESGLGWHLVFIDTVVPGRVPEFEEVEPEVKTAWLGEQKALAWQKAYKDMRAKYTVLLPALPDAAAQPRRPPPTPAEAAPREHRRAAATGGWPRRCCSPHRSGCQSRRRTSRGPLISRSRKPRPASTPCSGARRCWRACACRWC